MNHPLYGRSSRSLSHRPLALAVASSLLLAAALPAMASESLDAWQQQRQLQAAWAQPTNTSSPAVSVAEAMPAATGSSSVLGTPGDPASWRTAEFNADWGLAATNADYAYARGLTGTGIRLGVFDSGTGLDHPDFAGKNHRSIHIADLLADGSPCTNTTRLTGPGACFSSDGNDVQVTYVGFNANVPQNIRDLIRAGNYVQAGIKYEVHGTHVAGTIAANRDGNGMHGVAFGADLSVARLFFNSAREWQRVGTSYSVVSLGGVGPKPSAVIDMYAQMNAQGVRAVNHSWGLTNEPNATLMDQIYNDPDDRAYLATYADGSRANGMIQVWAAGNSPARAVTAPVSASPIAGMYATLPRAFADIEKYWLSVVNVGQDFTLSRTSNKCGLSANWCLAAPGSDINSTVYGSDSALAAALGIDANGNLSLDVSQRVPTYSYGLLSGTSMAAPHVTGALGLLFERFPYLDSAQVRDILLTTTRDLGAPGIDEIYGWGLMDLRKAIEGYGSLRVDTNVVMNQKAGGLKVWEGDAWDNWTNDIGGPGKLTKSGIGWLRLSGNNSFNGAVLQDGTLELNGVNTLTSAVEVQGGRFLLNGSLVSTALTTTGGVSTVSASGVLNNSNLVVNGGVVSFNGTQTGGTTTVGANGLLKGVGTLGNTRVDGIIAPGNSIGTLTINGNYVQGATGTYAAELAPGGRSDQLHVTGTATLGGTLVALPEPGVYYLGEQFNFLRADGGISGQFAKTDFSAFSPFLKFSLAYGANGTRIDVARGASLTTAANTPNQRAVAAAADLLPIAQGLPKPLTQLFPQQVGGVLDGLSGELHPATAIALVEGSRYVRDAALSRRAGATAPGADVGDATGAWVQAIGGNGKLDGDFNTARTEANSNGLLVGIDREFSGWQVGVLAGTGRTDVKQQDRRAKSKIDNTHFGAYASHSWGGFGLRGGVAWSKHEVKSTRDVAFAGFSDSLSARYDARTRQAFIEAGYRFGGPEAGLEPYLQVARVEVDLKRVNERGGAAALQGKVDDTGTTIATAGVRFDKGLKASFQQDSWLHLRGGVGYRRASGDRSQVANLAFANGATTFAVNGAPIADNAVVAELGLSAWLTPRQQLELGYSGQFGSESRDHGANARWSVRF
ncbi:TPA: autotransporter domain-containing protein [Stenotrophomonas maltophilia]|uniref:Autotransporter outer membrane beta-barrel domain-containing protein n=2 Tax=Gammaproteobacteria TaxID=1236 RepID=A0A2J0UCP9_STEMA|nr:MULTISPECIES: autotransporter serine protease [Stenotrophomonas]PJL31219.1 autotransporter outer membrane beta-barrel domain-containing protein [Stenotrophomonas maltophilia]HDS1146334.1 autotransporter domain-containing protein [Stenotrophomonas maltophilia]HDS1159815.1 autotransporter domain-containing protein [Stenotrophomonas maltophilia]